MQVRKKEVRKDGMKWSEVERSVWGKEGKETATDASLLQGGCMVDHARHSTSAEVSPSRCQHALHLCWSRASCVQHVGRVSRVVVVVAVSSIGRWPWAEADCE